MQGFFLFGTPWETPFKNTIQTFDRLFKSWFFSYHEIAR
jgi:hypothetical protein